MLNDRLKVIFVYKILLSLESKDFFLIYCSSGWMGLLKRRSLHKVSD